MLPSEYYLNHLKNHHLQQDPAQAKVLPCLDRVHLELKNRHAKSASFWRQLFNKRSKHIRGLYLWGGVGRGKTMLMDMLYESCAEHTRLRQHYHQFMRQIHSQLKQLKGIRDPLPEIAKTISSQTQLLCLDEFYVNDITDAMLLAGLLRPLFRQGVTLITTSNIQPDSLYADGLQRARFLPAIRLIKTHTEVVEMASPTDYRLLTLTQGGTYHWPLDKKSADSMANAFATLSSHAKWAEGSIEISGRDVPVQGEAEGAVWFDFASLCNSPRSQNDYLEIACEHHSVFLSEVPILTDEDNDAARRFLNLIDVLYDCRVILIISAATTIENIYQGKRLSFEFERAISRLTEMQSEQYLAQTHRS